MPPGFVFRILQLSVLYYFVINFKTYLHQPWRKNLYAYRNEPVITTGCMYGEVQEPSF